MATTIQITPPGGDPVAIRCWEGAINVTHSSTSRAGSFSLTLPGNDSSLIDLFPYNSDVQITMGTQLFRGWVLNSGAALDGPMRRVAISGLDYTAKAQKIIVNESYTDKTISYIVDDLFTKYLPWCTSTNIEACAKVLSIRFPDKFLWDVLEQICGLAGNNWDWYIDEAFDGHFFERGTRINATVLSQAAGNYKKGTANIKKDPSKLVNKLTVKGGKGMSEPYPQPITVSGATPIALTYTPRAPGSETISIVVDGNPKTVGIQHLHDTGIYDFLINAAEKVLIPDLCTSGTGTITYRYEYPIKIILEDEGSQVRYGEVVQDILQVDSTDRAVVIGAGLIYLDKYKDPVTAGTIDPLTGFYRPGELVKVEITDTNVDEYLQVKDVTYTVMPDNAGLIGRRLTLEAPERGLDVIIKDMELRLRKLEREVYNDEDGPVERYVATDEPVSWAETVTETVNACPLPSDILYPADDLYPC